MKSMTVYYVSIYAYAGKFIKTYQQEALKIRD